MRDVIVICRPSGMNRVCDARISLPGNLAAVPRAVSLRRIVHTLGAPESVYVCMYDENSTVSSVLSFTFRCAAMYHTISPFSVQTMHDNLALT